MKIAGKLRREAIRALVLRLWRLAAGTLLLAAALFCGWQTWLIATRSHVRHQVLQAQDQVAAGLTKLFRQQRQQLQAMLDNSALRADLARNDVEGREAAARLARKLLPTAADIVFFSPTLEEVVHANYDRFGYSRAAQLLAAQSTDTAPRFQATFKQGKVRWTLALPVGAGNKPLAYAWFELPFASAKPVFEQARVDNGRLDLVLGDDVEGLLLYRQGNSAAQLPESPRGLKIAGTRLIVYSALPKTWIVLPRSLPLGIALTVLALLAALALFWLRRRSLKQAGAELDEGELLFDVVRELKAKATGRAVASESAPEPARSPQAVPRAVDRGIFRAYDIRGVVGDTLDAGVARLIGQAVGSLMHEKGLSEVVIGRDGRKSGPELSEALAEGLREAGIEVIDIGAVPTPLVYFATYHFNTGSGVAVTGSHNPPDYNGFKIVVGGETLSEGAIQDLYARIAENRLHVGSKAGLRREDVAGEYIDRIADDIQIERPLKVVVDAGNGIAGAIGPQVLQAVGCQVIPLYCDVDGDFPNHHPDPADPENLQDLILSVQSTGADLGLAFDGDGDRLGLVTGKGEIIASDRLLMLFAQDVLIRNPGATIIYDVKCTGHLQSEILNAGGSPLMWRTGHSLIKAKMRETEALLAGEMSGHFFFRERWYGFDDGVYAAARLLEIVAGDPEERTLDEIFEALPHGVSTPELKIPMKEGEHYAFIERFREKASFEGTRVTTLDGVRADWKDGWGLVRASNTTPVLVLRFDADDEAALKRIQQAFREQLLAVKPDLKLPF